jgi:capsular exopolysaccharide synthesis family protein
VELRHLIAVVRAWLPLLIAAPLLAGATAYVVSNLQPKIYEANATLIVGQSLSSSNPDINQLQVAEGLANTYASIAESRPILERVIEVLGLEQTPKDLADRIQLRTQTGSSLLIISAQDRDPDQAAAIANTLGDELIGASPAIQGVEESDFQESVEEDLANIRLLIDSTQARYQALVETQNRTPAEESLLITFETRLVSLRATYSTLLGYTGGTASNILAIVEPAEAPLDNVSPTTLINTILAAALALMVVGGIAFLADQLDDSIKNPDAVREVTGLSNLGTITQMRTGRGRSEIYRMVTLLYPRSITAEAYRSLRVNVEFASLDVPVQTILLTSAAPGEGKSVTSANLAVVFAQAGRRVLLVDTDLRWPSVHKYFDVPNTHGLTTLLRGEATDLNVVAQATEQPNLRILPTGPLPPNPAEQLGSQRMQAVIELLRRSADIVIFDSPPLLAVADAAVLSAFADGSILVIDASQSKRAQVRQASLTLARAGGRTLGTVLNRVSTSDSFHYAGHYGESDADSASRPLVSAGSPDRS